MKQRLSLETVVRIHSWIEETQRQCVEDVRAVIWDTCPKNSSAFRHAFSISKTLEKFRRSIWEQLDDAGKAYLATLETDEEVKAIGANDAPTAYLVNRWTR